MEMAKIRKSKGLSQRDLAKICSVSQPYICMIETAKVKPYPSLRSRIAKALCTTTAALWPELEGLNNGS